MAAVEHVIRSARNVLASGRNVRSERSPLHDVRQHAQSRTSRGRDVSQDADLFSDAPHWHVHGRVVCSDGRRDRRWWSQTGSNRRPPACKAGALPTELWPRASDQQNLGHPAKAGLVGLGRFELPTSRLSSARSNQLSYRPKEHTLAPRRP